MKLWNGTKKCSEKLNCGESNGGNKHFGECDKADDVYKVDLLGFPIK